MASGRRIVSAAWRIPAFLVAVAMIVGSAAFVAPPALAQEGGGILRPWLRNLFSPPERRRPPGEVPGATARPPSKAKSTKPRRKPTVKAEPKVVEVLKAPDAKVVLVIGDFLGSGLAEGLLEVYAQNPGVQVIDRTKGSSGLVRLDVVDWPKEISKLVDAEKPAAIVVMLGSNDRQQMRVGDNREPPRSEAWTKEYERRADVLAKTIAETKLPYFWVGMPAFKSTKMTSDMLAFNDVYQVSAEAASGTFVDIWDGFVDENGAFVTNGPDINGQPVKLRASDGINLTKAGKRKVAFYVEKPLAKIVGAGAVAVAPPGPSPAAPGTGLPAIDTGIPVSLNDPELDGGAELLGASVAGKRDPVTPGEKLAVEGIAPEPAPGRADDFAWPPRQPPVAATQVGPPAPTETTSAVPR